MMIQQIWRALYIYMCVCVCVCVCVCLSALVSLNPQFRPIVDIPHYQIIDHIIFVRTITGWHVVY